MSFTPFGGIYSGFGFDPRNDPSYLPAKNPLPPNNMKADTGDAGVDGYTVLSRADPFTGVRRPIDGTPEYDGPKLSIED